MNLKQAKSILELPDTFDENQLKQKYHKMCLKYHPDKGGTPEKFQEVNQAFTFLSKTQQTPEGHFINLNDILKSFMRPEIFKTKILKLQKHIEISITPLEFLQGTTKTIDIQQKQPCYCEPMMCNYCSSFGFNCKKCLGMGFIQQCGKCTNGFNIITKSVTIDIPKCQCSQIVIENIVITLKIDADVLVKDNKLYYHYNITLKDSLTGFVKTFKDPFGIEHTITSKSILKENDGYFINENICLLFHVVYPKRLITQLKNIDF